jgi:GT2 family glycosyltransferase
MDKVGVIIPVISLYNEYTKQCLEDLFSQSYVGEVFIHVVDNGSTDSTRRDCMKLVEVGKIGMYTSNGVNSGVASSWNFGVETAIEHGCDKFLILNNDIRLDSRVIERLVRRLNKSDVGMATCMDICGNVSDPLLAKKYMSTVDVSSVEESEHPNFSAFMLDIKTWNKIGRFDEEFFPAYFEDNSYHYRMSLAGLKAITFPPALFYHFGSRTQQTALNGNTPITNKMFEENRDRFFSMWGGLPGQEKFTHPYNLDSLTYSKCTDGKTFDTIINNN